MCLRIDKKPNHSKTDYVVTVFYDDKKLETFMMSYMIEKMIYEGTQAYPKRILKILQVHGINDLSLEDVDKELMTS